jgi:excisionase family DNA binding protein
MNQEREETFLTVAEVAEWLKLNQQTVRNWIDQGSLPAVKVGRRVRIKQSDLEAILEAGYRSGSGAPPGWARAAVPSAEDFWSGEPVGMAELDPDASPPNRTEPTEP